MFFLNPPPHTYTHARAHTHTHCVHARAHRLGKRRRGERGEGGNGMAKKGLLMGGGGAGASRHSDSPVSVEIPGTDTTVADYLITDVEEIGRAHV